MRCYVVEHVGDGFRWEEVAAGEHAGVEWADGYCAPAGDLGGSAAGVFGAAVGEDGCAQHAGGGVRVGSEHPAIRSEGGEYQFSHLFVVEQFGWGAAQFSAHVQEFGVGGGVLGLGDQVGGLAAGDDQGHWWAVGGFQGGGYVVGYDGAHAVAEEDYRVGVVGEDCGQGFGDVGYPGGGWFAGAVQAAGVLD
ncbi:MAG TPA: hypothetical protein VGX23_30685 [Actinocrinis sp.]|nr:hypothetical protein [Actinocrinis sp.]